jgi:hypothetical protein
MRSRFVLLPPSFTSGTTWQQAAGSSTLINVLSIRFNTPPTLGGFSMNGHAPVPTDCHAITLHRSYPETNEWELEYKNTQEHNKFNQNSLKQ